MKGFEFKKNKTLWVACAVFLLSAVLALLSVHITSFGETQTRTYHNLVALVNFKDDPSASAVNPPPITEANDDEIQARFNASSDTETGADNLQSYLYTVSQGSMIYKSHFYIITLDQNAKYYRDNPGTSTTLPAVFTESLAKLEPALAGDTTDYSNIREGYLDGLTLYLNASTDGRDDPFWPHQTTMSGNLKTLKNLKVNKYMVIPNGIGSQTHSFLQVICHETLHMFGADDLYHYSKSDSGYESNPDGYDRLYPVGIWDIMGSSIGDYDKPTSVNSYYRWQNGLIGDAAFVTAQPDQPIALKPSLTPTPGSVLGVKFGEREINGQKEFFVVEKRNFQSGYDAALKLMANTTSAYTVYRVKTLVKNGVDAATGNRLAQNGDEIVYFDKNGSDDLSLRENPDFNALFAEGSTITNLTYSDGSACDLQVVMKDGLVTVETIVSPFRIRVTYDGRPLDAAKLHLLADREPLVLTADAQTAVDGSYPVSAPRGSILTITADGYTIPENSFRTPEDNQTLSFRACIKREFLFTDGGQPVAGIRGTLSEEKFFTSDGAGRMTVLFEGAQAVVFSGYGYAFSPAEYTPDDRTDPIQITLTKSERTLAVRFTGNISGAVQVIVNDGTPRELEISEGVLTIAGVKNGDVIRFSKESFEIASITVSHLTADDGYEAAYDEFITLSGLVLLDSVGMGETEFSYFIDEKEMGTLRTDSAGGFRLENIRKGSTLSIRVWGYHIGAAVVESDQISFSAEKLLTLDPLWLCVPAIFFLLQIVLTCARDYRRRPGKKR